MALLVHHIDWSHVGQIAGLIALGLGTAWGILATFVSREFSQEADRWKTNAQIWERRWNEHRCVPALVQYNEMQRIALEWRQRYELQCRRCEVEHIEKPLPTIPLSAEQAAELKGSIPF